MLITGETGTGKEVAARFLHAVSDAAAMPFIAVNCAAIPADLLESELFGHEKGAFTGASQRHLGYAERAGTGILFLDEIGELRLRTAGKAPASGLRIGLSSRWRRTPVPFRARLVVATNAESGATRGGRSLPRRSLLPNQRRRTSACRRCVSGKTISFGSWSDSSTEFSATHGHTVQGHQRTRRRSSSRAFVARQRARAAKSDGARDHAGPRALAHDRAISSLNSTGIGAATQHLGSLGGGAARSGEAPYPAGALPDRR